MSTTSKFVFITAALASLTIVLSIQQQDVAAFNDKNQGVVNMHNHFQFLTNWVGTSKVVVTNSENVHSIR